MKVISIFNSIDGEVNAFHQGCFSTFIRLAGCNLHCQYCDTKWSWILDDGRDRFDKSKEMTPGQIISFIESHCPKCKKITITGGEPLLQKDELYILQELLFRGGFHLSVETNGTLPIPDRMHWRVGSWVVDYKSSSVGHPFERKCNYSLLYESDWIKFVVGSKREYEEIRPVLMKMKEISRASIAVSPMHKQINPADLVKWLQDDGIFHCIINLQLHKIVWPDIKCGEER